ncbi:MAG: bifunctional riboflavin kinase/FAD synthetase [Myxococcota bacterium]
MEYIKSEDKDLKLPFETAVAIGNFDGVHIAHQRLIRRMVDFAKNSHMKSLILTFRPHTAHLFDRFKSPHLIMSYEEKIEEISKLGVDILVEQRFDEGFASLSTQDFLYKYLGGLGARAIFVGFDFSFSRNKSANQEDLREFGRRTGTFIEVMDLQTLNGMRISSTKIRNLLQEGNIEIANQLLGRRYYICQEVVRGKMIGSTIGVATANISLRDRLLPREGVYLTITEVEGSKLKSISNIGKTSHNQNVTMLETHIFDFNGELYGKKIKVEFLRFIRPELRFGSIEELREAIERDIQTAHRLFRELDENNQ